MCLREQDTMIVTTRRLPDPAGTVLHVAGEVDTYAADELRRHLRCHLVEPDGEVLVDLTAVTFMSCSALRVLAEARDRLGSRLVVGGRSRAVQRLLELTDCTSSFAGPAGNGAASGPAGGARPASHGTGARTWTFSRSDVDRVRDLLMAVHGCDAERAWRMLALAAARHGVPLGELAQLLIRAHGGTPSPAVAAAALTVLMRAPREADVCGVHNRSGEDPPARIAAGGDRAAERSMAT
jgi:anti-anti-sigma factor